MTSLRLVRCIRAQPQIVFDAVTTAEAIAKWWGPDAGPVLLSECDPRVGGRYRVRLRGNAPAAGRARLLHKLIGVSSASPSPRACRRTIWSPE
jgi:uncharacterized protein YndB with AHSA1/START domain